MEITQAQISSFNRAPQLNVAPFDLPSQYMTPQLFKNSKLKSKLLDVSSIFNFTKTIEKRCVERLNSVRSQRF
jgi:hypothetical protein